MYRNDLDLDCPIQTSHGASNLPKMIENELVAFAASVFDCVVYKQRSVLRVVREDRSRCEDWGLGQWKLTTG